LAFNFCASLFRIAHAEAAFQQMTDTLETLTVEQAKELAASGNTSSFKQ
jgi:hypothetical protein